MLKATIRGIFTQLGALPLMDDLHLHLSRIRYLRRNYAFRAARPDFQLPPDALLHETYRLDYRAYERDGFETAAELLDRCRPFLPNTGIDILEWGCGVSRITRHLPSLSNVRSVAGADVNREMIDWNRRHVEGVEFHEIGHTPPMSFQEESFDLVLAVSVLTHIPGDEQAAWMEEIRRILRPGGVFLFTTQGSAFLSKLTRKERRRLMIEGHVTRGYRQPGHRMVSTFESKGYVDGFLQGRFVTLDFADGDKDRGAAGGQDLWIVRSGVEGCASP